MHDVQGLIDLFGSDERFIAKLDGLFAAAPGIVNGPPDVTGFIGQDAQGNEPSNHIPYLYAFAGAAWKTQYWARKVMARWYTDYARWHSWQRRRGPALQLVRPGSAGFLPG